MLPVWESSLAPFIPWMAWCLVMTLSTGLRLSVNSKKGAGTWESIAGPWQHLQVSGTERAHLEAALQDGKTGGNSLTGISFIWAEPDQLFLIKTHFATCSNVIRSSMCAYVQRKLSNVPSTGHIYKVSTWLRTARQVVWIVSAWPEACFPGTPFCRETQNNTITSVT